jgi:hypothetical protein
VRYADFLSGISMRYVFGCVMLLLSGSLSAEILTFECTPDEPIRENRDVNVFVVDTSDNTLAMNNGGVFSDTVVSERVISAKGKQSYISFIVEISRVDLTYKKTQWLNAYENTVKRNFTGQCKIVGD